MTRRCINKYTRYLIAGLQIGFTVYGPDLNSSNPLIFNSIVTNIFNGYNKTSGKFTCQFPGLYLFTVMVYRHRNHSSSSYCYIYVNGIYTYVKADADGPANIWPTSTNTLVRHLNKGDKVYLVCGNVANMYHLTGFSGVLIQPDDTVA